MVRGATREPEKGPPVILTHSEACLVEKLIVAHTDGCRRRSFDDDLLPGQNLGRIVVPHPSITEFFEGQQRSLISHVKTASSVLRGGPLVVQGWIDEVRYDLGAWGKFQAACTSAGVSIMSMQPGDAQPQQQPGDAQPQQQQPAGDAQPQQQPGDMQPQQHYSLSEVRALMGVLVTKYVHANLEGLLRHLKVLVQADKTSDRALRDERRADAATAAKKSAASTAAASADGPRRGRNNTAPAAEALEVESVDEPASADSSTDCDSAYGDDCVCHLCNEPEPADAMLLCDSCDQGYHNFCLTPRVDGILDGLWFCPRCAQLEAPAATVARKRAVDAAPAEAKRTRPTAAATGAQQVTAATDVGAAAVAVAVSVSAGAAGGLGTAAAIEPVASKQGRAKRRLPAEAPPIQREGARKRVPSVRLKD